MEETAGDGSGGGEMAEVPCAAGVGGGGGDGGRLWGGGWKRKIAVAGAAVSSVPVVLPPLLVLSAVGLAFSVPFGVFFAGYACADRIMRSLLPLPAVGSSIPPQTLPPQAAEEEAEGEFGRGEQEDGEVDWDVEEAAGKGRPETEMAAEQKGGLVGEPTEVEEEEEEESVATEEEQREEERTSDGVRVTEGGGNGRQVFEEEEEEEGELRRAVPCTKAEEVTVCAAAEKEMGRALGSSFVVEGRGDEEEEEEGVSAPGRRAEKEHAQGRINIPKLVEQEEGAASAAYETGRTGKDSGEAPTAAPKDEGAEGKSTVMSVAGEPGEKEIMQLLGEGDLQWPVPVDRVGREREGLIEGGPPALRREVPIDEPPESGPEYTVVVAERSADARAPAVDQLPESLQRRGCDPVLVVSTPLDFDEALILLDKDEEAEKRILWDEIDAVRTIVGRRAPRHRTCMEELRALYLLVGVELPVSTGEETGSRTEEEEEDDVEAKLRLLKSIIGVE